MSRDAIADAFYALPPAMRRPEKRKVLRGLVPAWQVAPRIRANAHVALEYARLTLPLDGPIAIQWMTGRPQRGQPSIPAPARRAFVEPIEHPREIFLLATVPDPVETVLHEARHHWQYRNGRYPAPTACSEDGCGHLIYTLSPADEDRLELDATRWAATALTRLQGRPQ